jgi:hypothetical protein
MIVRFDERVFAAKMVVGVMVVLLVVVKVFRV